MWAVTDTYSYQRSLLPLLPSNHRSVTQAGVYHAQVGNKCLQNFRFQSRRYKITWVTKSQIGKTTRPFEPQEVKAPRISGQLAQASGKVVSSMHRPRLSHEDTPCTHLLYSISRPQGHSAAGWIQSNEKFRRPHQESNPRTSGL